MATVLANQYKDFNERVQAYVNSTPLLRAAVKNAALRELQDELVALQEASSDIQADMGSASEVARRIVKMAKRPLLQQIVLAILAVYSTFVLLLLLESLDGNRVFPLGDILIQTVSFVGVGVIWLAWARWRTLRGAKPGSQHLVFAFFLLVIVGDLRGHLPHFGRVYLSPWFIVGQVIIGVALIVLWARREDMARGENITLMTGICYFAIILVVNQIPAGRALIVRGEVIGLLVIGFCAVEYVALKVQKKITGPHDNDGE